MVKGVGCGEGKIGKKVVYNDVPSIVWRRDEVSVIDTIPYVYKATKTIKYGLLDTLVKLK